MPGGPALGGLPRKGVGVAAAPCSEPMRQTTVRKAVKANTGVRESRCLRMWRPRRLMLLYSANAGLPGRLRSGPEIG